MAMIMKKEFNTKGSLRYFRNLIPLLMVIGFLVGLYGSYLSGKFITALEFGVGGLAGGVLFYFIQLKRYGDTKYIITNSELVKKHGNRIIRSIQTKNIEYFYFSEPETLPRVKVKGEKDFDFAMTKGVDHEILAALETLGIKSKN